MIENRISLALGGGAAKGLAHVGVLRGLEEDGVKVAAIAGTSMGAIVGGLFAGGMRASEMEALFTAVDWAKLARIMVRSVNGSAFSDLLQETLGNQPIEDLSTGFAAVACDLENGEKVVQTTGGLADAVRASSAIPAILPPIVMGGRSLVDGALVAPVPVAEAADLADAPVLAVNVLRPPRPGQGPRVISRLLEAAAPTMILDRIEGFVDRHQWILKREKAEFPNRLDVLMRSFHMMQYNLAKNAAAGDWMIEPDVGAFGWFDFQRAGEIMAEGYQSYRELADAS